MSARHFLRLLASFAIFSTALADPPAWWLDGNPPVIDTNAMANNHGPANIGQTKWMAKKALLKIATLDAPLAATIEQKLTQPQPNPAGGTYPAILDFTVPADPKPADWIETQKSPLLIGQLKAIAAPFYQALHDAAPAWIDHESSAPPAQGQLQLNGTKDAHAPSNFYPWSADPVDDQNNAIATIGQLKAVFSLRFDTLPTSTTNSDHDWLTYLQQYLQGKAPGVNNAPGRLGNGGNTAFSPIYGTADPGGGGDGPQIDQDHDYNYSLTPQPASLWARAGWHTDSDGNTVNDYTTAHLTWYYVGAFVQSIAVQRRDSAGNWSTVGNASPGATEYNDDNQGSGLLACVSYLYRLAVTYSNGQTQMSNSAGFRVPLFKGMSYRQSSIRRQNPGFTEFVASNPPKYYLTYTKTAYYDSSYSDSSSGSTTTGHYEETATISPDDDSTSYVGSSTWYTDKWDSGGSHQGYHYNSTENTDSSWTGTYSTWKGSKKSGGTYNQPYYSGLFYGSNTVTATNQTNSYSDNHTTESVSETLSDEYAPGTFFSDTIDQLPDYPDWTDLTDYGGYYGYYGYMNCLCSAVWDAAYRYGSAAKTDWLKLAKMQYQFHTNPSDPITIKFYEIFVPDTIPPAEAKPPQVVGSHTFTGGASGPDSAVYEIDPSTQPDAFVPDSATGYYYVVPEAQLGASGYIRDYSTPSGGFDYASDLDPQQKTSGIAVLRPPDANGEGAITGSIDLPNYRIPGSKYVVNLTGGSGFTVKDANGQTITSGMQITQAEMDAGTASLTFTITANGSAADGQQFTITLTASDANGESFGTDSVTFTNQVSANRDMTVPLDEASGSRYRKIGLNGRPLSDEKPHQTAESDEEKEETYIDALTLGLRHSTTDVYIQVPGSDLAITARRDTLSEVWNMHSGLRPHERFDRPFGAGWSSNVCANLELYWGADGTSYAYVTDQNGARHRFVYLYGPDGNGATVGGYVPLPSDNRENGDYLTSFDFRTFTDRYGTKITFNCSSSLSNYIASDRNQQSGTEYHAYYGVSQISDRYGNTLIYSYPDPATVKTLIPSTISLAGSPNQVLSIEQDATGHITKIWDPNGNQFSYGYTDKVYNFNGQQFAAKTLTSVTGPDGRTTQYGYDFQVENDLTPADLTNGQPTPKLHLDVSSITNVNSSTYTFSYAFDQTRWNYNTKDGYFRQTGAPRYVSGVTLPGGLGKTTFVNNSKVAIKSQYDPDGKLYLTDDSQRRVEVTDAGGNGITYKFGEGAGNSQIFNVGGFFPTTPPAAIPKIVFYKTMEIDYAGGYEKFTFDPSAGLALSSVRDFSGNTTSYVYGDAYAPPASTLYPKIFPVSGMMTKYADPTSQTDALNQSKSFTYGAWRIMNGATDENGRFRSYQLDDAGRRLNEVVYQGNASSPVVQTTEFAYESAAFPGAVTKKTLQKLNGPEWSTDLVTQYVLDDNGRVWKEIVSPGGLALTTTTTYDRNGNKLSVTDPNGHTTGFEYDQRNRLTKVVYADGSAKTIDYDLNGNKWHEMDENGHVTTFTYDALDRLATQTRAATMNGVVTPLVTRYGYENAVKPRTSVTDPNGNTATMQYDGLLRLSSTTDALGRTTTYSYTGGNVGAHAFNTSDFKPTLITDPRGYQTQMTYDALYRTRVKNVQYQLVPALFAHTEMDCDGVGNVTQTRDPLNHATTTDYDALNRPYHVTFADAKDVWTDYTPTGLNWKVKDELGYETETHFDGAGRAVLTLGPAVDNGTGNLQQPQTQTIYDGSNVAATINPLGKRWDYGYDVRNRKIEEDQPAVIDAATGLATRPKIYTGYDYVGNVLWVQDARGYTTETSFDEVNRPLTTLTPPVPVYGSNAAVRTATTRSYDANGNVLTVSDSNGHVTVNTYDWLNRLKTTKNAANDTVTYDYDEVGNRILVKDGLNQGTTFAYDGLNRNTSITDAAGKATVFAYNGVNKTSRTDAKGQVTSYSYDLRDRVTAVTYPGRAADNRTYRYNFAGTLLSVTEPGKGGAADVTYTYDALRRVITETGQGATHHYRYDLAGNRVSVQYGLAGGGNGRLVASTYDALNRLSSLTEGGRTTSYAYDLNGNVLTKTLPNTETVTMAYDGLNRMLSEKGTSPKGVLYNYLTLCDAVGNIRLSSEYTADVPTRTLVLAYDNADRLVNEKVYNGSNQLTSTTVYGYDAANNRRTKAVGGITTSYAYNVLNQVTGWTDTASGSGGFTYDFNGNRSTRTTGGQTDSYGYDVENRLVSLTKNTAGGSGSYGYMVDYRTRRVRRTENGVTTDLVFSGGTSVQEYTSGTLAVDYVRGSDWGGGVGGVLYSMRSGVPSFAHYDRRGDVTTRTDSTGVITYQASYEAGGKRTEEFGTTQDRQKANTKDEDPTGLLNEGFRYRDLETGSFITRDPLGFVDGPNVYTYVNQNPWTSFDPEGLTKDEFSDGKFHPEARLYKVRYDPKHPEKPIVTPIQSAKEIKAKHATIFINGMACDKGEAAQLGLQHTGKKEYYLIDNPSEGCLKDLGKECITQRWGNTITVDKTTKDLLKRFDLTTASVVSHSQGTMIFNNALEGLNAEEVKTQGMKTYYDGAAAHYSECVRATRAAGASIERFAGHPLDPVYNIVGLNTKNPLRIVGSLVAAPLLFAGREWSPHSYNGGGPQVDWANHVPLLR